MDDVTGKITYLSGATIASRADVPTEPEVLLEKVLMRVQYKPTRKQCRTIKTDAV